MNKAAEEMDFEQAIIFRNHIEMLERSESYILSSLARDENFDCFAIKALDEFICINVNAVRNGKTILDKNILLDCIEDNLVDALSDFLLQYYEINAIPQEILVNLSTSVGVEEILKDKAGKKVEIKIPQIGIKKRIMEQACKNVDEYLEKNLEVCKPRQEMVQGALKELAQILELNSIPYRIECYDISNISGKFNVASMVVFENGIPAKREYRKFKIKTVEGANDFLSMKEVLERRLKRLKVQDAKFKKPDLIIVDGGLGQLSSASESMRSVGIDIPLVALAKQEEEIFTLKSNESIKLTKDNNARKLVQRIRDEAHRFAITYHKSVRDKEMFKS